MEGDELSASTDQGNEDAGWASWAVTSGAYTGYSPNATGSFIAAPSGFANAAPTFPIGGPGGDIFDGFTMAATLTGAYDTNPSQGYTGPDNAGQSDFLMSLGGGLAYRSKASVWTFGANYAGSYSQYFEQSELSGYAQNAAASVAYDGGPLEANLALGIGFGSGANRYYASVVDEITYSCRLSARYRLSAKTFLTGELSQSLASSSGASSGVSSDRYAFGMGASALWRYSSLTEFGPGIRYTFQSGDSELDRSSIGPTLTLNYKLSRKVSLNSRVGMDFAEYSDGASADPMFSMMLGLNYQASRLWGMNLSLLRDSQADPSSPDAYNTLTTVRLGCNRRVRRAVVSLGVGYETSAHENSRGSGIWSPTDPSAGNRPDRDYFRLDGAVGMPVFSNSTMAVLFLRHTSSSGSVTDTWDSTQLGFSLSRAF